VQTIAAGIKNPVETIVSISYQSFSYMTIIFVVIDNTTIAEKNLSQYDSVDDNRVQVGID